MEDARAVCDRLAREGIASTVCYWDVFADEAAFISQNYTGALQGISKAAPDCYLSVKAPALKYDFSLIRKILDEARRLNATVHFDAMAPGTVDPTFDLIRQAREVYPNLGCTLPSRWARSLGDAEQAIALRLRIRIVKGQWIGTDETDPREGFLKIVDQIKGRALHVAVATHNPALARISLRQLKDAGTPCELELLYGLPQRPLLRVARHYGVRARLYVPYGQAALPYRLKEAVLSPRIIGWFLYDLLRA
jgi:proline dehydrogenase